MSSFDRVTRSLTNPFNVDPDARTGTECDVAKIVHKKTSLYRSLSTPRQAGVLARSAASMKREKFQKKRSTTPTAAETNMTNLEYFNFYHNMPPTPLKCKNGTLMFEVDRVLGKIVCKCGRTKYLVKWAGYSNSENSCITKLPEEFRTDWA